MELKVDDLVLSSADVQSEADWPGYGGNEPPAGSYTGHLLDKTYSYDDPILLENKDLRVSDVDAFLIHPNQFTTAAMEDEEYDQSQPWSQGCQITCGVSSFNELNEELAKLGYQRKAGSTVDPTSGGVVGDPDTIEVNIKSH